MDILEANFGHVLPGTEPEVTWAEKRAAMLDIDPSLYSFRFDFFPGRTKDEKTNTFIRSGPVKCSKSYLMRILCDLQSMVFAARRNDTDLEHIKALLKHTVVKLERLHRNPSLFSSITESEKFFKQGIKLLLRIQKHNNAWQAMEEAIRKFEELNKDKARSLPPLEGAVGENTSTWTVWCRNNVLFPSPGEIQEAEIYKTMLPMICQTLPLGGIYILEHWRQEAESVIQPLLRVENRPRKAGQIIRDQQATPRRIYIVDTAAKEQSKTTIRLIEVKSERQHMQVHTQITVEPIDGLAGLLAKFNKSLVRGSAYGISALLLKNSCSASRIRDRLGPKTCIWNAEKFLA